MSSPTTIAIAPDGTVWFTESNGNRIGRMNPDGTHLAEFDVPTPDSAPRIIALGADGNIWFSEFNTSKIGRITPEGDVTEFDLPRPDSGPGDITAGADGALWFIELNGTIDGRVVNGNRVGRITLAGQVTEFAIPSATGSPTNVAVGPDRNVWYTKGGALGRVSAGGDITEFPLASNARGVGLTADSDRQPPERLTNRLWYADGNGNGNGNKIGYLHFR